MMSEATLDQYLRRHTPEEELRLKGINKNYSTFPVVSVIQGSPCYRLYASPDDYDFLIDTKRILMNYSNFAVIKQDRFETVPLHVHNWLELIYVYSGSCTLTIDQSPVTVHAGQMILITQDTPHSVEKCLENDILVNFIITKEYLNGAFFERLPKDNFLTQLFVETLNTQVQQKPFLLFASQKQNRLASLANQFLCEFFSPSVTSEAMLDSFMTLLACELINVFQNSLTHNPSPENSIYAILRYIETNYMNCTLASTANFFNMHPNYLSAYIRKHTGKTYKQLIQASRLSQAAKLLRSTLLPVSEISLAVGYQNFSFFFQKFEQTYGCTPKEYREKKY